MAAKRSQGFTGFKDPHAKKGEKEGGLTGYLDRSAKEKGGEPMFPTSWEQAQKNAGKGLGRRQ